MLGQQGEAGGFGLEGQHRRSAAGGVEGAKADLGADVPQGLARADPAEPGHGLRFFFVPGEGGGHLRAPERQHLQRPAIGRHFRRARLVQPLDQPRPGRLATGRRLQRRR